MVATRWSSVWHDRQFQVFAPFARFLAKVERERKTLLHRVRSESLHRGHHRAQAHTFQKGQGVYKEAVRDHLLRMLLRIHRCHGGSRCFHHRQTYPGGQRAIELAACGEEQLLPAMTAETGGPNPPFLSFVADFNWNVRSNFMAYAINKM